MKEIIPQPDSSTLEIFKAVCVNEAEDLRRQLLKKRAEETAPFNVNLYPHDNNGDGIKYTGWTIGLMNERDYEKWFRQELPFGTKFITAEKPIEINKAYLNDKGEIIKRLRWFGIDPKSGEIVSIHRFMLNENWKPELDEDDAAELRVLMQDAAVALRKLPKGYKNKVQPQIVPQPA